MKKPLKIVLGVPTYKRPVGLRRVLASIARLELDQETELRVVVAENDLDGRQGVATVEEIRAGGFPFPIETVLSTARGISQARNALMNAAFSDPETDMLAMVDDDQWMEPIWLERLVAMQRQTEATVVGGYTLPDFEGQALTWELKLPVYWRKKRRHGKVPMIEGTCGVLFTRKILDYCADGYFDEKFSLIGGEDKEFFTRILHRGCTFAFADDAIAYEVFEADRRSLAWAKRRAYRIGASDMRASLVRSRNPLDKIEQIAKIFAGFLRGGWRYVTGYFSPEQRMRAQLLLLRSAGKLSTLFGLRYESYRNTSGK
ncbi:glycosyltransferase family 2 protein [Rhizobiaceae bacterium BDR2-2]|uniref:Glycosyltransferase family 2 protein n=1 Tax=Ectorhizobium quercum TaxID=2965071 RepID=A0AAE3N428_9HYPH|nr:glycosyltransferase family 2 protein [Ectorhizobium quercum]MCX8998132.1 glycosyltransferase family 2 protein [Ectorhizobium quercum]